MLLVWKSKFTYHPGQESITRTSIILPIKLVALLCAALFFGQKPLTWCFTNLKFYLCSKDMFLLFFSLGNAFLNIFCAHHQSVTLDVAYWYAVLVHNYFWRWINAVHTFMKVIFTHQGHFLSLSTRKTLVHIDRKHFDQK